jgi:hypothetical protein
MSGQKAAPRKISEVFFDFVSPLVTPFEKHLNSAHIESTLRIAYTIWNSLVLAEVTHDTSCLDRISQITSEHPQLRPIVHALIERKQKFFTDDHRLIGDYKVTYKRGGFVLGVEARDPYSLKNRHRMPNQAL